MDWEEGGRRKESIDDDEREERAREEVLNNGSGRQWKGWTAWGSHEGSCEPEKTWVQTGRIRIWPVGSTAGHLPASWQSLPPVGKMCILFFFYLFLCYRSPDLYHWTNCEKCVLC